MWFVPVVCVLGGLLLSTISIAIDEASDNALIPRSWTGGPDAAIQILGTIAASMVSLAALVLTITMVVVQLAMGQFSPRIVQTILKDKPSQFAIGLFIATFAHALLTMRVVEIGPPESVPGLALVVAYVLVLVSIVVLVLYVHHIGQALRVSALIELVGTDTRELLDQQYASPPDGDPLGIDELHLVRADRSGVICEIRHDALVDTAREARCSLAMLPALGEFVPSGAVMFTVSGEPVALDHEDVLDGVVLGLERTLERDAAYGFRMLVDIAERSISESPFQDPTTAIQAIDRLHDCLRQLSCRRFPDGVHRDADGVVRLTIPVMDWDAYVVLAFEEIRLAGARSPQVTRRLVAAITDLMNVAPPSRHPVLEAQLSLIRDAADDSSQALRLDEADHQGIGVRAGRAS